MIWNVLLQVFLLRVSPIGSVLDLTEDNSVTTGPEINPMGACYLDNGFTQLLSVGQESSLPMGPLTIWDPTTGEALSTAGWNGSLIFTGTAHPNFLTEGVQFGDLAYDPNTDRVYFLFTMYSQPRWIGWANADDIRTETPSPDYTFTITMLEHPATEIFNSIIFV